MPFAFTNGPIVFRQHQPAETAAEVLTSIDDALLDAGWTATAATGGYVYEATSPQGLTESLYVYDAGDTGYIRLRFPADGMVDHPLGYGLDRITAEEYIPREYAIWANQCQLFVWIEGYYTSGVALYNRMMHTVQLGIPHVPSPPEGSICESAGTVTQALWIASCATHPLNTSNTFRDSVNTYRSPQGGAIFPWFNASINGDAISAAAYGSISPLKTSLRLLPLIPPSSVYITTTGRPRLHPLDPAGPNDFLIEAPAIGWGKSVSAKGITVAGELWDSLLVSDYRLLDEDFELALVDTDITLPLRAFGYAYRGYEFYNSAQDVANYGGILCLLRGLPTEGIPELGNYVY